MSPLDHALRYVRRGFKVFPLVAGTKMPATPSGFKAAVTDEAQVRRWWTPDGFMGIGIATGDFWVLDIDGDVGRASLEDLEKQHGTLPETLTCWTGGGGAHFYFAAAPGLRNRTKVRPGIDVRAEGGYVVGPPSMHESGMRYAWHDEQAAILPAPAWLLEVVTTRAKPAPRSRVAQAELPPAPASAPVPAPAPSQTLQEPVQAPETSDHIRDRRAYARGALRRACRDVEAAAPGTRNDVLNKRAFSLGEFIREGLLERTEVETALDEAADTAGLAARETRRTLESALKGAVFDPAKAPLPEAPAAEVASAGAGEVLESPAPLRAAEAFLGAHYQDAQGRLLLRRWRQDWYRYDSGAYVVMGAEMLEGQIWQWADQVFVPGKDGPKPLTPTPAKVAGIARALLGCGTLIDQEAEPPVWAGASDSPGRLLPVANGLLDIRRRELHPASPDLFATAAIPVAWTPEARCPTWKRFLESVWGSDHRSVDLLQEWFGYVVSGDTSHHKMLFIEGPRRSGKGTIARMMTHVLGAANVSGTTLSAIGQRFGLAPLQHRLLAIIPDARIGSKSDLEEVTQTLLSVSGQDGVLIDRKNRDAVTGRLSSRFMVLSNELPRLPDNANAISSRFLMLRTERSFLGRENLDLEDELLAELPGILVWALDGYDRLREQRRFTSPSYEDQMREEMTDLSSPINTFVQDECLVDDHAFIDVRTLFSRYMTWTEEQNMRAKPLNVFVRDVRAAVPGVRSERLRQAGQRQRILHGITVRNLSERALYS